MPGSFITLMDLIGTVAFAISGAMAAIEKKMDLFGIMILALTTATGGGFIRDLTIGNIPPMVFRSPVYIILSFSTAVVVFLVVKYVHGRKQVDVSLILLYEKLLLITDSLGLAAFTVDGVNAGKSLGSRANLYLIIFLGVVTGVGGGVVRDLFAARPPFIFVRHVYALASLAGAFAAGVLPHFINENHAYLISFGIVLLIRYLAAHYRWNLPRIS